MTSKGKRWNRNVPPTSKPDEELLVFGYSCKIFRDDDKATYIDQGKHLIPWMGDENLMIDRYDVRGYLHDLSCFETEHNCEEEPSEEEKLCDEERYLSLRATEEELYHEEELKRLRAAVASDGAYHEIGFSYDTLEESTCQEPQNVVKEEEKDEPYEPPTGLNVPKGMPTPSNMKIHAIIEKTAIFVSKQGGQMEIIIKMKQGDNPQFAFMQFDNPLHPYYRHLVQEIKSGRYKPVVEQKVKEEEHADDHYLHPSLVSGIAENVPKFTVPVINFRRTGDDSYSLLVKNLKHHINEDAQRYSPTTVTEKKIDSPVATADGSSSMLVKGSKHTYQDSASDSEDSSSSDSSESEAVVPPPPEVQPVIIKMAEYVAKNGEDFETIVKSKNDKRFDFLNPGHKYYSYYIFKQNSAMALLGTSRNKQAESTIITTEVPAVKVSNSSDKKEREELVDEDTADKSYTEETVPYPAASTVDASSDSESTEKEESFKPGEKPEDKPADSIKQPVVSKAIKGPICFSLRSKDNEVVSADKVKKTPLLLDDSDDENYQPGSEKTQADGERKVKVTHISSQMSTRSVPQPEAEEKPKKLSAEELEVKMAEEKLKDKLMAAARERLAQQKKDKQLQLERKQKAALFLKMLQSKKASAEENATQSKEKHASSKCRIDSPDDRNGSSSFSPVPSEITSPERIIPISSFPPSPISNAQNSNPSSPSSTTGSILSEADKELPLVTASSKLSEPAVPPQDAVKKKKSKKRSHSDEQSSHKSKKHSRSKKHHRSRSRSRSPSRKHKSSSSKSQKDKKLPAAYAISRHSRSRSRSPRRHGLYSTQLRSRSPWSRYR